MEAFKSGADALFIFLGVVMVLAMHAGFAFLELGTVRAKNQVNALVKILTDFSVSTPAYFFVGYGVAYGISFMVGADTLAQKNGYELVKFFFLLTFAAAIPAIVSGGIRSERFSPVLSPEACLSTCSRLPRIAGKSMMFWVYGLRTAGVAHGAASLPAFSAQRRWVALVASR